MSIDTTKADAAALVAQEALAAANNARDAAEIEWLGTVTSVQQINEGRTQAEATRLKSRLVGVLGFAHWQKLVADSRR